MALQTAMLCLFRSSLRALTCQRTQPGQSVFFLSSDFFFLSFSYLYTSVNKTA